MTTPDEVVTALQEFAAPAPKLDKLSLLGEISEACYRMQADPAGVHHDRTGTGRPADEVLAEWEHREVARLRENGMATWTDELREHTADVYAAHDWAELRPALIRTAALALCWLLDGDRNGGAS